MKYSIISILFIALVAPFTGVVSAPTLYDKRFGKLKKNAEAGNRRAQYKLGIAYLNGVEVKVNIGEALKWFKKSARQKYVKAYHRLGLIYYMNLDGSRSYTRGYRWMIKAANKDHGMSQYYVGKMYLEGKGIRKDVDRAMIWAAQAKKNRIREAGKLIAKIETAMRTSTKRSRPVTRRTVKKPARSLPRRKIRGKTRDLIISGYWKSNTKPAQNMPSAVNRCKLEDGAIRCKSERIKFETNDYTAHYTVDSMITDFRKNGEFLIRYRRNYVFVLPADADDPNPKYELPRMGQEKKIRNMKCQIVTRKIIKCIDDKRRITRYIK